MPRAPSSPVRALAKAVAASFAKAELTPEEQSGQILHTDLEWVTPALRPAGSLSGVPLSQYLDVPLNVDAQALHMFWATTLETMWVSPSRLMKNGVHVGSQHAMPNERTGERAYRFALPAGYPGQLDPMAGIMFSMEVAHVASLGLPHVDFVVDDDNYYVVQADGTRYGVVDGLPAVASPWVEPMRGMVGELAYQSRGAVNTVCQYDQLAAVRSLVHQHRNRFIDFEGMDTALQALRCLTLGQACPDLLFHRAVEPQRLRQYREQYNVIKEMVELMEHDIPDRAKLYTLDQRLVPAVISRAAFKLNIYSGATYPFALDMARLERIKAYLADLLAQAKKRIE